MKPLDTMRAIAALRGLTAVQKSVLFVLVLRTNNETGECWPSLTTIAQDAGVSRSTAQAALADLISRGLLAKEQRQHAESNVYRLQVYREPVYRESVQGVPRAGIEVYRERGAGVPAAGPDLLSDLPNGTAHSALALASVEPVAGLGESKKKPESKKRKHGTSVPASDAPVEEIKDWCAKWEIPHPDSDPEVSKFVDHFRANGKTMLDWTATWRNWKRRAPEFSRPIAMRPGYQPAPAGGPLWLSGAAVQPVPPTGRAWQVGDDSAPPNAERAKPNASPRFKPGDEVRVLKGAFANLSGTVEEVRPASNDLVVTLTIRGMATPIDLGFGQVAMVRRKAS